MADNTGFKFAGYVSVKRVELYSAIEPTKAVDLTQNFLSIDIQENMQSAYLTGSIHIVEPYGMIYSSINQYHDRFPHIKGEEFLLITYEDDRTEEQHTEQFFVYAVSDIKILEDRKETALEYRLNFCSPQKFLANTRRIRKAYRNMTIAQMVDAIFKEYYEDIPLLRGNPYMKDIAIEETTGTHTITIPNLTPEEAILFLARKAYSSSSKSSLYFFFETREKFWFFTHEGLKIKNQQKLNSRLNEDVRSRRIFQYTNTDEDNTIEGQNRARQYISRPSLSEVNTAEHIKQQGYRKNISEMDILNRTITRYTYEYKDNYFKYNNIENLRLDNTEDFIDLISNRKFEDSFVVKDYAGPNDNNAGLVVNYDRPYTYYPEVMSTKPVFHHHFNYNKMGGQISGRYDLYAGDIIKITIPEFSVNQMENPNPIPDVDNSGNQIVMGLNHMIKDNKWSSYIMYTKAGKAGGPESRPNEAAGPIFRDQVRPGQALAQPFVGPQSYNNPNTNSEQLSTSLSNPVVQGTSESTIPGLSPIALSSSPSNNEARTSAESYLGRPLQDQEWEYLVRATVAEAGPNANEQAAVMGVILNRTRSSSYPNTVQEVLQQPFQFQAVTGTRYDPNPSQNFARPSSGQINSVTSAAAANLSTVNTSWLNFTSNVDAAYGRGTDISFRDRLIAENGSQVIGDSVFGTI